MYKHGGDIISFAKILNTNPKDIIDLSSNINFLKPNIKNIFDIDIASYPNYDELINAVASFYNVDISNISLYNGASSAIYHLLNNLKYNTAYIYSPAYLEYKRFIKNPILIDRFANIDIDIQPHSLVVFVNPSTPDGKYYDIDYFMQKWIKLDCTIIVDESFLEFVSQDTTSATKYIEYKKLYIIKSMTKIFASAGVRIGTIISNSTNLSTLNQNKGLWQISSFDSYYIQEAIKDKNHITSTQNTIATNYQLLKNILSNSKVVDKIYDSDTNYILIKLNISATILQNHLMQYKILIRDCDNFDFLDNSYVRIAIKDINSINTLKGAIDVL